MAHGSVSTGGGVIFQASVLYSNENAKFWTIWAILSRIYTQRTFTGRGGSPKLTHMRYGYHNIIGNHESISKMAVDILR